MRATIRPVSINRIAEVVEICTQAPASEKDLQDRLDASENRVREITAEMTRLSLVYESDKFDATPEGEQLHSAFINGDWGDVHQLLYESSPHYMAFSDLLRSRKCEEGLYQEEITEKLNQASDDLKFNKTGVSLLSDWGERLGVIQRNVFNNRYYWAADSLDENQNFRKRLEEEYEDLEVERGVNLKQRYISIPRLRESLCESLGLRRSTFDQLLADLYLANIGNMEMSGAPLNTQAKDVKSGIKTISVGESGGLQTTEVSSESVLRGITLSDGKMYYYLTIFGQLKEDS